MPGGVMVVDACDGWQVHLTGTVSGVARGMFAEEFWELFDRE